MQITFDTSALSALDKDVLRVLLGEAAPAPKDVPAPKAAPAPKAEAPKAEAPEAEEPQLPLDEDLVGAPTYTLEDVIKLATKAISSGGQDQVKAALAAAGVKRVSELKADNFAAFVAALEA